MDLTKTTVDLLRRMDLLDDARKARNQYLGFRERLHARRLAALYADGTFGRGHVYAEWKEEQRAATRERLRDEQRADRRALLELVLRSALAPAVGVDGSAARATDEIAREVAARPAAADPIYRAGLRAAARLGDVSPDDDAVAALAALPRIAGELVSGAAAATVAVRADVRSRAALLEAAIDALVDDRRFPHAYEYDYLDDLGEIVRSRSATGDGAHRDGARQLLGAIAALASDGGAIDGLGESIRAQLGTPAKYVPKRGPIADYARGVIPDLVEEFITLKARDQPERFLEMNREYSRRQRDQNGALSPAGLSLLMGYEREPHLMLRTIVELVQAGKLRPSDQVLVIGPRHANEMRFFSRTLGIERTVGLDLFDTPSDGIVGGDMHHMSFETGQFKLVYCCGTLSYAYAIRKVIAEIARVVQRPGYVVLSDAGDRVKGVDPLGRSDPMNTRTMIGCFHEHAYDVLFDDDGVPPVLMYYRQWPCVGLALR